MHLASLKATFFITCASVFTELSGASAWPRLLPLSVDQFSARMDAFYSPQEDWRQWIEVDAEQGRVRFDLEAPWMPFAEAKAVNDASAWRAKETPHVALDPGHLGGTWGPMEGRSFRVGDGPLFQEGDAVLHVAQRVQELLEPYAIRISLVREEAEPLNPKRPQDYLEEARAWALEKYPQLDRAGRAFARKVRARSELLFYRSGEILARADFINQTLQPDLVVCLHINAHGWPDPRKPSLVPENDLHFLVHGNYTPGELAAPQARWQLAHKIAHETFEREQAAAAAFAKIFRRATELPPFIYGANNAAQVDADGYVWARNLAANRAYHAPVIFLEPYVANSEEGYARIRAGEYTGRRKVAGKLRLSLLEEYARATASSLIELFKLSRR